MAHVLFLTQTLPYPLDSGAKVRQYHMLRHLARRHEVTLVSFVRGDDPPAAIEHLRGVCHAVHPVPMQRSLWRNVRATVKSLVTGLPMMVVRDEIAEMTETLRRLVQETAFDVVHADQLSMAGYGRLAVRLSAPHVPKALLDEHNAFYLLVERMATAESRALRRFVMRREARTFRTYEAEMCRAYDAILTVIPEDREYLQALVPTPERAALAAKTTVVPICVDPGSVQTVSRKEEGSLTILHVGTMFWPPNIHGVLWFAREVLPLIHQEIPDAQLVVIGKNPPAEVEELTADSRVHVTGYVPELLPYLEAAGVFVVPLHAGSGMRVKILDAWMWGIPIVSTPLGAEGIETVDGENILLADNASAFADATVRTLSDTDLSQRLLANGRAWVESHYSWEAVYAKVDSVYETLLGGAS